MSINNEKLIYHRSNKGKVIKLKTQTNFFTLLYYYQYNLQRKPRGYIIIIVFQNSQTWLFNN